MANDHIGMKNKCMLEWKKGNPEGVTDILEELIQDLKDRIEKIEATLTTLKPL